MLWVVGRVGYEVGAKQVVLAGVEGLAVPMIASGCRILPIAPSYPISVLSRIAYNNRR